MASCTGYTTCAITAESADFKNHYADYPLQNLCVYEPIACYMNGGACPPDCGGPDGAAMINYGCELSSAGMLFDQENSPGMSCQQLFQQTGICFDGDSGLDSNAGQCEYTTGTPNPITGIRRRRR